MIIEKKNLYPLVFLFGFNLITFLLFLFAPFNYFGGNVPVSIIFVFLNLIFLLLGYFSGCLMAQKLNVKRKVLFIKETSFFNFIFIFYCFTFFIKYAYLLRFNIFDWTGMVSYLAIGWFDPQLGYKMSVENVRAYTVPWSIMFFISIFNSLFFINGFIFWKKFNPFYKTIFMLLLLFEVLYWYGRGTNFGIIMLIVIFFFARMLSNTKLDIRIFINSLLVFVSSIFVFAIIMSFRSSGNVVDLEQFALINSSINYDSWVFKVFPESTWSIILLIFSYITQGYYYLSFAFNLPFNFTYFSGISSASLDFYSFLGVDFRDDTYIYKLNAYGVDPGVNWHSAYLWFANDFSFYGVPFVIFLIGFLTATFWVLARRTNDIIYKMMFVIFSGIIVFLFSNTTFISFFYYSLIFLFPLVLIKIFFSISR